MRKTIKLQATELRLLLNCCPYFFGFLVGNLRLGYKATLNSNMYSKIRLLASLDYVKELCLLHYADEESYKATSKLKKHIFDMFVINAICISNKHL